MAGSSVKLRIIKLQRRYNFDCCFAPFVEADDYNYNYFQMFMAKSSIYFLNFF